MTEERRKYHWRSISQAEKDVDPRLEGLINLQLTANDVIKDMWELGLQHGYSADTWRKRGERELLLHARDHLEDALAPDKSPTEDDHLTHALCDVAMAILLRDNPDLQL